MIGIGILTASLAIKASAVARGRVPDPNPAREEVRALAQRTGFTVSDGAAAAGAPQLIVRDRNCSTRLFILDPFGNQVARVEGLRRPGEQLTYEYRGRRLAAYPRFWPVAANYGQVYLVNLGIEVGAAPVFAALSDKRCRAMPALALNRVLVRIPTG